MKNAKTGLTAVVLGVAFAATSFAATAGTAATPLHHAAGKISAIDAGAKSLTLAVNGKTEQVSYTPATTIHEGGKNVAPAALASGERVRVAFEEKAGKNIATSIEIIQTASPARTTKSK